MRTLGLAFVLAITALGCNGGSNTGDGRSTPADLRQTPDLAYFSCCGQPGDPGNELGVGKYCEDSDDCPGSTLCLRGLSPEGEPPVSICSVICQNPDGGSVCGDGASCVCRSLGCACIPDSCQQNPPAGCAL